MFRMYARNSHSYTHLILALGIVREPTVWGFIIPKYPGIHDIGLAMVCHPRLGDSDGVMTGADDTEEADFKIGKTLQRAKGEFFTLDIYESDDGKAAACPWATRAT